MAGKTFMTRRAFLQKAMTLGLGSAVLSLGQPWRVLADEPTPIFNSVKDPDNPTPLEEQHLINIRLPEIAEQGSDVPVKIAMEHPMEADHYIKSLQILVFDDPIVSKGVYHFTPANGELYFYTQIRMDGGDKELFVVAECSEHGKWVGSQKLKVAVGGC